MKFLLSSVYLYSHKSRFLHSAERPAFFSSSLSSSAMSTEDKSFKDDTEKVAITDADELQLVNALSRR